MTIERILTVLLLGGTAALQMARHWVSNHIMTDMVFIAWSLAMIYSQMFVRMSGFGAIPEMLQRTRKQVDAAGPELNRTDMLAGLFTMMLTLPLLAPIPYLIANISFAEHGLTPLLYGIANLVFKMALMNELVTSSRAYSQRLFFKTLIGIGVFSAILIAGGGYKLAMIAESLYYLAISAPLIKGLSPGPTAPGIHHFRTFLKGAVRYVPSLGLAMLVASLVRVLGAWMLSDGDLAVFLLLTTLIAVGDQINSTLSVGSAPSIARLAEAEPVRLRSHIYKIFGAGVISGAASALFVAAGLILLPLESYLDADYTWLIMPVTAQIICRGANVWPFIFQQLGKPFFNEVRLVIELVSVAGLIFLLQAIDATPRTMISTIVTIDAILTLCVATIIAFTWLNRRSSRQEHKH